MARIIRKVIQKRLNANTDKQYIFNSSSSKDRMVRRNPLLKKDTSVKRNVENVNKTKRISLSPEPIATRNDRFSNRINKSVNKSIVTPKHNAYYPINIVNKFNQGYQKNVRVDYDVVIVITSFNRYEKAYRIIKQLFTQKSKYTFKVILLNDGSTEGNYDSIKEEFPDIDYLKNEVNGGKRYYWRTVTTLWNKVKDYETHAMCQIDDDLILCNTFINRVLNIYFRKKEENNKIIGIHYHPYWYYGGNSKIFSKASWKHTKIVTDGGTIFDIELIKIMNHTIPEVSQKRWDDKPNATSLVWVLINNAIRMCKCQTFETEQALAYHDGNNDSKLNTEVRNKGGHVFTDRFIDGNNIQFKV